MRAAQSKTTAGAAAAGAAVGSIIAWGLSLIPGIDVPVEVGGAFSTLGAFLFGVYLPR